MNRPAALITALLAEQPQDRPLTAETLAGGRNSRVQAVRTAAGRRVAVKRYPDRTRLETEWRALSFLAAGRVETVPRPLALDSEKLLAAYSFIEGRAPAGHEGSPEEVEPLISFLETLRNLRTAPGAPELGPAAEALLDPSALLRQIERRLDRLREAAALDLESGLKKALGAFLDRRLSPTLARRAARAAPPPPVPGSALILSPSDFGFHNAVSAAGGQLVFVDFEYFGWDDPAKLLVDTLLHPHERMRLLPPQRRRWLDRMLETHDDGQLLNRSEFFAPLLGLKWALILLNEFLPEAGARRALAGRPPDRDRLFAQLDQAEKMLARSDDFSRILNQPWDPGAE